MCKLLRLEKVINYNYSIYNNIQWFAMNIAVSLHVYVDYFIVHK